MFWLVILGIYMGWVEAVYGKPAEKPLTATDSPDWNVTLPEIPEMYKAEPAVREAERVVRGTPLTVKNIKDALRRSRR
jgi:hypothetical protein